MLEVRAATRADRADVIRVMSAAFADDPVTRWMVPAPRPLAPLFRAHVRTANQRQQHIDVALLDGAVVGAAIWQEPGYHVSTGRQLAAIPWYVAALGRQLQRGARLEGLMHRSRPAEEFWYLAGVGAVRRGEGIGSSLLRHRLDEIGGIDGPTYLESSKEENVPLYERFGFELREVLHVPEGPDLWPMWRKVRR